MTDTTGLRHRKKQQTRRALLQSAYDLFEEKGFRETSIEDITTRANFAPRTFFLHFTSKEELLFIDSDWMAAQLVEIFKHRGSMTALAAFKKWQDDIIIPTLSKNREYEDIRRRLIMSCPQGQARVASYVNDAKTRLADELAKDRDLTTPDLSTLVTAAAAVAIFVVFYEQGIQHISRAEIARAIHDATEQLTGSLET